MGKKVPQLQKTQKEKPQNSGSYDLDSKQVQDLYDKPVKQKAKNGEEFWSLTKNKRVTISVFNGKPMVNIREYFQKDGEWLPTKKGISLAKDSWKTLKKIIKDIDVGLAKAQK